MSDYEIKKQLLEEHYASLGKSKVDLLKDMMREGRVPTGELRSPAEMVDLFYARIEEQKAHKEKA